VHLGGFGVVVVLLLAAARFDGGVEVEGIGRRRTALEARLDRQQDLADAGPREPESRNVEARAVPELVGDERHHVDVVQPGDAEADDRPAERLVEQEADALVLFEHGALRRRQPVVHTPKAITVARSQSGSKVR
jgi:hypothetical protein